MNFQEFFQGRVALHPKQQLRSILLTKTPIAASPELVRTKKTIRPNQLQAFFKLLEI